VLRSFIPKPKIQEKLLKTNFGNHFKPFFVLGIRFHDLGIELKTLRTKCKLVVPLSHLATQVTNGRDMKKTILILILVAAATACTIVLLRRTELHSKEPEAGVSLQLACERSGMISGLRYSLNFDIPIRLDEAVGGEEKIFFNLNRRAKVQLDAKGFIVNSLTVNGESCSTEIVNEHLILPRRFINRGANEIEVEFTAGEQSLNRREEFLYTLLVPDRARTLFPCFDQPDLKARYRLSLTVPPGWIAVSNATVESQNGNTIQFGETEPLSTYLFSFVAGKFECVTKQGIEASGKPIRLYHRETDPERIAQCPEILDQVNKAIDWLEDYTGIKYPFGKYDLVIIPDFQYGGMEHTGSTLYNDRRMFLNSHPTTDELLGRAELIAHETSHMWFGDLVTMKWFNDVWTKEVFANFFAAKIVRPLFPTMNHQLNDMGNYYAAAYSEDRTKGSNAIQRPLSNLNNAGLIYCNIIYDKSPVVMSMLESRMGEESFRDGIRGYLKRFSYGNATWDDLIAVFSALAPFDLREWSRVWVKEKGMPQFSWTINGDKLTVTQQDPFGGENVWQEPVSFILADMRNVTAVVTASFEQSHSVEIEAPFEIANVVPNSDGKAYGWFKLSESEAEWLENNYAGFADESTRMSVLMTLYENTWHGNISPDGFIHWACGAAVCEQNALIRNSMMGYLAGVNIMAGRIGEYEEFVHRIAADGGQAHESRLQAFRSLIGVSGKFNGELLEIWRSESPYKGLSLSERDYTSMAYQLMLRYPDMAVEIRNTQAERNSNPDRKEAFIYVSQACSPSREERDEFFNSLLDASTRGPESRVTQALSLLSSPLHPEESISRIAPALEVIEDIQRNGDIFFPSTWCEALLGSHSSKEASEAVKEFVELHHDLNPMLMTKILQKGGWLLER